jgi:hypothetical protein
VPGNDVVRTELNANRTAKADLLIVDNDRHWEREDAVEALLQGLGVSYHVVEGEPSAETMKPYKAVTWITTTVSGAKGVIPTKSVAAITEYLEGGGKFWFMSSRAMNYIVHPDVAVPARSRPRASRSERNRSSRRAKPKRSTATHCSPTR